MVLLNTATKVYAGASLASKVYAGAVQVWPPAAAFGPNQYAYGASEAPIATRGLGTASYGCRVVIATSGRITGMRYLWHSTGTLDLTRKLHLWNWGTGASLGTVSVTRAASTVGGWQEGLFPTPIAVAAGLEVMAAFDMDTPDNGPYLTTPAANVVNGDLTRNLQGYNSAAQYEMPTVPSARNYFADIIFQKAEPPTYGWTQYVNDPLTSLSGLSVGGVGTWSINTCLQGVGNAGQNMRAWSTTSAPTSPCAQLAQVEIEVPSTFTGDSHLDLGWLVGDSTGKYLGAIRAANTVAFVQDGIAWGTESAYVHPAAGVWMTLRVLWDHQANIWQIWVDGALLHSRSITQAFGTTYKPGLLTHSTTSGMPRRFRNLKAWYQTGTSYAGFPS